VVITRCTNNYGPYQFPEKLIPLFATNAIQCKKLPVYGTGKNTRDWIHVMDHCRAIDAILHAGVFGGEVFNIGAGEEHSVLEIAGIVLDALGKPRDQLEFVTDRPGHVVRHAVDAGKIRNRLGWAPVEKFTKGIRETVLWYQENEWWWKKLLGKRMDFTRGPPKPKGATRKAPPRKPPTRPKSSRQRPHGRRRR
jgi:dTDP-glucose 4,6-dehydratase